MSMILTLSGMSTSGKTTLAKALTSVAPDCFAETISVTTRRIRPGEIHGREYYFVQEKEFKDYISSNMLAEHVNSHSAFYGTLKSEVSRIMEAGKSVVMVLEPQGVANIQSLAKRDGHVIQSCFLDVDLETLLQRFFARINEQKDRGFSIDFMKEAERMETMLIKEMAWSAILPWDIRLSNLHMSGEFDKAIDRLVDLHLSEPRQNTSEFALSQDVVERRVSVDMLVDIIKNQMSNPVSLRKLTHKISAMISPQNYRINHGKTDHLSGLSP